MSLSLFLSESNTLELPKSTGTAIEMRKYFFFGNLRNPNDVIVQPTNSQQSDLQNFVVGSSSQ